MADSKVRYEITVMRITTEAKTVPGQWTIVGQEIHERTEKVIDKYGHTPARKEEVTTKEQIYQQVIDKLELSRLVVAIQQAEEAALPPKFIYDPAIYDFIPGIGIVPKEISPSANRTNQGEQQ